MHSRRRPLRAPDRFWNDFSAKPARFTEADRAHYAALYAGPGRMHAGFLQFAAFDQDAIDNRAWMATHGKLTMPVLAIGGEKSFGATMAAVTRAGAVDVQERVIADAGHWLMEEQPDATVKAIRDYLDAPVVTTRVRFGPVSLSSEQVDRIATTGAGTGTSGMAGIRTVLLSGDPAKPGSYTLEIRVPAHTTIAPHTHRDDRVATVVSGTWYFGYGADTSTTTLRALGAGGFYSEPGRVPHFAATRDEAAVVRITGTGPSDTAFVSAATPR
ncbi:hypothetical protein QP164_03720 [Sphingomonas sp. LR59]|uniref:hypothetical protein n=1 Tax=Sphingomonas sp. LR59 TaxID=3050232 RepID=UPI002FE2B403